MIRRRTIRRRSIVVAGALAFGITACGDDAASRADTVAALTDAEVPAEWAAFADEAAVLEVAANELCVAEEATTADVSAAVAATRASWSYLTPWWFGPVMDRRARFIVDSDVDTAEIDELLDSGEPIDATALRDLYGADQRGLGAIDAVLSDALDERTCEFVVANAELVRVEADALAAEWVDYGSTLGADDAAANEAIELMVNESLFALAALRNEADAGVAGATLRGIEWAMVGDGTDTAVGIAPLLDDDVAAQLAEQLAAAIDDPSDGNLMAVEVTITTNVVSALGLAVQFSDADGDG
ncbi:MAG: hypothetical protein AAGA42_17970 [Actinomycetota bacterium]